MTKLPHIPSQLHFSRLSELSPSRYTSIANGCAFSFLMQQALISLGPPSRLMPPLSYRNVIGTIIHKVFELINKGELTPSRTEIKAFWKAEIKKQELRIARDYPSLTNLSLVDYHAMYETIKVAEGMGPLSSSVSSSRIIHPNEHRVKIPGLLKGSIDRVESLRDGTYRIVDYKTGRVFEDDGIIKEEYISQLNLYAYLLEEQDNVRVSELVIVDRNGTPIPVPYYPENKQLVLSQVDSLLSRINRAIEENQSEDLILPGEKNCQFCQVYHICSQRFAYQETAFKLLEGTITRIWNDDQLELTLKDGTATTIAKLRTLEIDEWPTMVGKEAIFVNLLEINEGKLYNRTDNTVIYIKD